MRVLLVMPEDCRSEHGLRAWHVATALRAVEPETRLLVGTRGEIGEPEAAVVLNGPRDREVLAQLAAAGVPTVYSLAPGAISGEAWEDTNALAPDWKTDRRQKMSLARLVHVDTAAQATVAEAFYGLAPRWLVLPPAAEDTYPTRERRDVKRLLAYGTPFGFDLKAWALSQGLALTVFEEEYHLVNECARRDDAIALWARPAYYGERLLTVAATGTPLAARRMGVTHEGAEAEWYDTGAAGEALETLLTWDEGRVARQRAAAGEWTWEAWAREMLTALERLCERS